MNTSLITGNLGRLLLVFAAFLFCPIFIAMYLEEETISAFCVTTLISGLIGAWLARRGSGHQKGMSLRDCFAIVASAWLLTSGLAALPYWLSGSVPTFVDALFESVSGLTTTGASVIADVEALPKSILFWRSLTQWVGGLGIIILLLAFLPSAGKGAVNMFKAEFPGPKAERVTPRIHDTASGVWIIYIGMTIIQVILMMLAGLSLFDAVNHTFTTIATGGFSTKNVSVHHFDNVAVELIIAFFAFLSGGNFALYLFAWRTGLFKVFRDAEFQVYFGVALFATLLTSLALVFYSDYGFAHSVRLSLFQVVSVMTSTGFTTADYDQWPPFAKAVLLILMFTGACAGSTAAGIKIIRLIILYKQATTDVARLIHPRIVRAVMINGKPVEPLIISGAMNFVVIYMGIYALSVLCVTGTGLSLYDALAAVAATLGNVGPAFGVAGPTSTYASLAPFAKVVLIVDMLFGRLEIFPLLVLLYPDFWRPLIESRAEIADRLISAKVRGGQPED